MIGIFDSGVGGLTVAKEIFKYLPDYPIIYFGDTARLPYGTKGENFVKRYSKEITKWLLHKGANVIVIACHTSSAWAADFLRKEFDVPIFDVITPAVKEVSALPCKKIGIIGTPGTCKSKAWEKRLLKTDNKLKVYSQSCPLFVPLVEEAWGDKEMTKMAAREYLKSLKSKKIDALVLACTHYPMLKKLIQKEVGDDVKIINPAESLAKELKAFLNENPKVLKKGGKHQFFFSDEPYNFEKISHLCFNKEIKIKIGDPF